MSIYAIQVGFAKQDQQSTPMIDICATVDSTGQLSAWHPPSKGSSPTSIPLENNKSDVIDLTVNKDLLLINPSSTATPGPSVRTTEGMQAHSILQGFGRPISNDIIDKNLDSDSEWVW